MTGGDVRRLRDENEALREENARLRKAIRKHRDTRGDDRCFQDDADLYAALPEGDTRPASETLVTIENCARYIECRQGGREYVSPQRRIEELEREVADLRRQVVGHVDRIAGQSELLARRAMIDGPADAR